MQTSHRHLRTPAQRPLAVVHLEGQHLCIHGEQGPLDLDICTTKWVSVVDETHGQRAVARQESLLRARPARANAGLAAAVCLKLAQLGYAVRQERLEGPLAPLPPPDLTLLPQYRPIDRHVLNFVPIHAQGLIEYDGEQVEIAWTIAQIASAFASASIAIVTVSRHKARQVAQGLTRWVTGVTLLAKRSCPLPVGRVVVGTYRDMDHGEVELGKRDIVICLDALEALHEQSQTTLLAPNARFRLLGLLRRDRFISPREWDWLMAVFGPHRVTLPGHGLEDLRVEVTWLRTDAPRVAQGIAKSALIATGVHSHPTRNRRLADLAQALVGHDDRKVRRLLADGEQALAHLPADRPARVGVVVESLEHAINLAELLPAWPLAAAGDANLDGLPTEDQRLFAERRGMWNLGTNFVATTAVLPDMALSSLDVIIWAGGGQYGPPLGAEQLICAAGEDRRLLLVDCDDRHHPLLRRWSRRRFGEYLDRDWFGVGIEPSIGRTQWFLKQRPKGAPQ